MFADIYDFFSDGCKGNNLSSEKGLRASQTGAFETSGDILMLRKELICSEMNSTTSSFARRVEFNRQFLLGLATQGKYYNTLVCTRANFDIIKFSIRK